MASESRIPDGLYSLVQDVSIGSDLEPLCDTEISEFFRDIDKDGDGNITFEELSSKLVEIYKGLEAAPDSSALDLLQRRITRRMTRRITRRTTSKPSPVAARHEYSQLHEDEDAGNQDQDAAELLEEQKKANHHPEREGLRTFLTAMMPDSASSLSKKEFIEKVKMWNVPSQVHNNLESARPFPKSTWYRKLRAYWSVQGPKIIFISFCVCMVLAFSIWEGVQFYNNAASRAVLSSAVIVARMGAGALWPTMFLLLLSMSRWTSTYSRHFQFISNVINWDRSESFHIRISCVALLLATMHSLSHMTGTLVSATKPENEAGAKRIFRLSDDGPVTYRHLISLLPGWTGIVALSLFWIIAILSLPTIRKRSYELFQLGHLLMFPFFVLLCVHGTLKLVAFPMLGLWIMVPCTLIVFERGLRFIRGFIRLKAWVKVLDKGTLHVTIKHPRGGDWGYRAGQYILLQVPEISLWQWHPLTIAACRKDEVHLIVATGGDWTKQLGKLAGTKPHLLSVGLDGPFGAPAQRFYDFDRSLIIGSGVGITPFSAILADMELNLRSEKDPWAEHEKRQSRSRLSSHDFSRSRRSSFASERTAVPETLTSPPLNSNGTVESDRPARPRETSLSTPNDPVDSPMSLPTTGRRISWAGNPFHPRQQSIDFQLSPPVEMHHMPSGERPDYFRQTSDSQLSPLGNPAKSPGERPTNQRQTSIASQLSPEAPGERRSFRKSLIQFANLSRPASWSSARGSSGLMRVPAFNVHTRENDQVPSRRRVDFHWMVRERNSLRWLSSLLNRVHDLAAGLDNNELELNIATHITAKKKNVSEHIFRYLLDSYRTKSAPFSALTGLKARSNFGRPDLEMILNNYYKDEVARMKLEGTWGRGQKVGVFFCGNPQIGRVLADTCAKLTAMGRADGSKVRFVFMMEVFM